MDMVLGAITVGTYLRILGAALMLLVAVYIGAMQSDWD
jgi:hypothetical protein